MSNTDPRYEQPFEGTDRANGPQQSDTRTGYGDTRTGFGDGGTDYGDDRTGYDENRTEYRENTVARQQPVGYDPVWTDRNGSTDEIPTRKVRETKPAFLTTEFWFAAGGIAALIVIYLVADDPTLDLFRTALLASLIGIAYIVSRGLAKAGSRTTWQPEDPRLAVGRDLR